MNRPVSLLVAIPHQQQVLKKILKQRSKILLIFTNTATPAKQQSPSKGKQLHKPLGSIISN